MLRDFGVLLLFWFDMSATVMPFQLLAFACRWIPKILAIAS